MSESTTYSEKDLDQILDSGFKNSPLFANWFISKTRFSNLNPQYKWSRSDHPWGRFTFEITDQETGEKETITRDSETDILVTYETEEKQTVALHVENKLASGKFTLYQPDMYPMRAKQWIKNEKFGNYTEFETILVAPNEFYSNNFEAAQLFDKFISYEEVAILLPAFAEYLSNIAAGKT